MKKQELRTQQLLKIISQNGIIKITDLAESLNVSEMTIRRDVTSLQKNGLVSLFHGAAVLNPDSSAIKNGDKYYVSKQNEVDREVKMRIAQKAVSLIEPKDNIILDVGSTAYYMARALPHDIPLTVICYSVNTLIELYERENCDIIFAGGYFHRNALMFESNEGIDLLKKHRANKGFIGATGINDKMGITSSNSYETDIKRAAMKSSFSKILIVDSSKFGKVTTSYFADIDEFDILITDDGIQNKYKDLIQEKGLTLYTV